MIKLKNIVRNDNISYCDIYPEDSSKAGKLKIDNLSGEVLDYELPEGYEHCINHVNHARYCLVNLAKQNSEVKNTISVWY